MNILLCQGRSPYPLSIGGAARISHRLMLELSRQPNVQVECLGTGHSMEQLRQDVPDRRDFETLGIKDTREIGHGIQFDLNYQCTVTVRMRDDLTRICASGGVDFVWAQQENAGEMLRDAKRLGVPGMLYLMSAEYAPAKVHRLAQNGVSIACLSKFLVEDVAHRAKCQADLLYPIVDFDQLPIMSCGERGHYVLMINAFPQKGIYVFLEIARLMPETEFLLQESWPLDQAGREWIDSKLRSLPNVRFQSRVADMASVYASAKLLIVPSRWQEGFGMVVVEAQNAGVPVIASRRGGLPEAVDESGAIVDDYENPRAWASEIERMLSTPPKQFDSRNRSRKDHSAFSASTVVKSFLQIANLAKSRAGR